MNVQIRAKDLNLSDATKAHIEGAIDAFSKFQLDITTVNFNARAEKKGVSKLTHSTWIPWRRSTKADKMLSRPPEQRPRARTVWLLV